MFLGKLFIVSFTCFLSYIILTKWEKPSKAVTSPYFPIIACGIVGYIIGSIFLSIFSFASDALMQCFLLDEELAHMGKARAN